MEVAGPLGTPLGLAQRKRASPRGEAVTSGFLSVSDSDRRVPAELGQERQATSSLRKGTPLASRVAQGVSGPSSSCVWNPRVFADDARGWQCPFVLCLPPKGGLRRGVWASGSYQERTGKSYIMRKAGLEEAQAGIKIVRKNINNLRYADDTTLMAESEELKSLLMKVKVESEKVGLKLNIHKKNKVLLSHLVYGL